jgi:hypothetical protein
VVCARLVVWSKPDIWTLLVDITLTS